MSTFPDVPHDPLWDLLAKGERAYIAAHETDDLLAEIRDLADQTVEQVHHCQSARERRLLDPGFHLAQKLLELDHLLMGGKLLPGDWINR